MLILFIGLFVLVMLILSVMTFMSRDDEGDENILEMRKRQSKSSLRELALKKKLEEMLEDRVEVSKKFETESRLFQAGLNLSYGEYRILTILLALLFPLTSLFVMKSIYQLPVLAIIGFFLPGQIVEFLRNRRLSVIEKQVGSFIKLSIERYSSHGDFGKALRDTTDDFKGNEPLYSELLRLKNDLDYGRPINEALRDLHRRVGNQYLLLFTEFYEIASSLGTKDARDGLMREVYKQYRDNEKIKSKLRKEIAGPKRESFVVLSAIPFVMIYQSFTSDSYLDFMLHTSTGQMGLTVILTIMLATFWFINKKIGAPIN